MLSAMHDLITQAKISDKTPEFKLNTAQVMIAMMMIDDHIDEYQYDSIIAFFTTHLHISKEQVLTFIKQVEDNNQESLAKVAKQIKAISSTEECAYILSIAWRIALVDGDVAFSEEQYLNQLAHFLEIPDNTLSALKKQQEKDFPNLNERNRYQEF